MAYLGQAAYEARFGAAELGQVLQQDDERTFDVAVADAEAIVNGYLAAVPNRTFAVPLTGTVPPRIVEITADLARYELFVQKATHEIKRRRAQAIEFLENMVKGLVAVPELLPEAGAVPVAGGAEAFAAERVFDACSLSGYVGR